MVRKNDGVCGLIILTMSAEQTMIIAWKKKLRNYSAYSEITVFAKHIDFFIIFRISKMPCFCFSDN